MSKRVKEKDSKWKGGSKGHGFEVDMRDVAHGEEDNVADITKSEKGKGTSSGEVRGGSGCLTIRRKHY